jgi:hypothetical protein
MTHGISMSQRGRGKVKRAPYVVFISHGSTDLWIAQVIAQKISVPGIKPWLDEIDMEGGNVVVDDIIRGIDSCHEAIILVSPSTVASQWVVFEIGAVRGQHKRVTPVLNNVHYDAIKPMSDVKAINLNEFDKFLKQLKRRVHSKMPRRASA